MQAWRVRHPPKRGQYLLGTQPLVHHGFLRSWLAGGLNEKVINHIVDIIMQSEQQPKQPFTVYVTGMAAL